MVYLLVQQMMIMITLMFLYIKLNEWVLSRTNDFSVYMLTFSSIAGIQSTVTMMTAYQSSGLTFGLTSVPLFLISYAGGKTPGLIALISPVLYRIYTGGIGTWEDIMINLFLPVILGTFFQERERSHSILDIIDIKQATKVLLIFLLMRGVLSWYILDSTLQQWIEINGLMMIFSLAGLLIMITIKNDANKRIEYRNKLYRSEEKHRKLLELLPEAVFVCIKSQVFFANQFAIQLLHKECLEDVLGQNFYDLLSLEKNQKSLHKWESDGLLAMHPPSVFQEFRCTLSNRNVIDVEVSNSSFYDAGHKYDIIVMRDISERKRMEELQRNIEDKKRQLYETLEYEKLRTEFFSNLSHELRTPINLIYSTVQLLEQERGEGEYFSCEQYQKKKKIIKQNCNRMIKLVNNLIDITKIDSGYFNIEQCNCNIVSVVEDIVISIVDYVHNNNISILFDTEEEEIFMSVDPNAIERIMLNLLSNAIKFTKPGDEIFVDVRRTDTEVNIHVRDTGVGIPADKLEVVFDRFRQVDKSLTRNREGSGIGLSLVNALVKIHDGRIAVYSEENQGSEFIVTLPITIHDEELLETEKIEFHDKRIDTIKVEFSDIYSLDYY